MSNTQKKNLPKTFKLTKEEIGKLKTIMDYIFNNQTKYYANYQKFEECFNYINNPSTEDKSLPLYEIYKEIIGQNRKYMTVPRFINKYIDFKSRQKNVSINLKKFFSYIMTNLLKKDDQYIGNELNESTYSSTNFKTCQRLSDLTLLNTTNNLKKFSIFGFIMKYDNNFTDNLYNEHLADSLCNCLEIKLPFLKELNCYDGITHVYGTFSNEITFIGFKCRSGKKYTFGYPNGEPFLFGDYNKELFCIRTQISKQGGVVLFLPIFKETNISNEAIDELNGEEIKNYIDDKYPLILEEKYFNKNSKEMTDDIIKNDDLNINNNNVSDQTYSDFIKNLKEKIPYSTKEKNDVKYEAEEFYKDYINKLKLQNKYYKDLFNEEEIEKEKLKNSPYGVLKKKENEWDGFIFKNLTINKFKNKDNLYKIINRLEEEISREIAKELLKYEYDQNFNFYDEYLYKHDLLIPYPLSPKKFKNYSDIKDIEFDFDNFTLDKENEEGNTTYQENDYLYSIKDPNENYSNEQIIQNWKKFNKREKQFSKISLVLVLMNLYKAMEVFESVDKNFYDDYIPLEDKIKIYKSLVRHKDVLIQVLNNADNLEIFKLPNEQEKTNKDDNYTSLVKPQNLDEKNYIQLANEMTTDDVIKKLIILEDLGKQYPKLYPQLSLLYMKYRKIHILQKENHDNNNEDKNTKINEDKNNKDPYFNDCINELNNEKSFIKISPDLYNKSINTQNLQELPKDLTPIYKNQQILDENSTKFEDPLSPKIIPNKNYNIKSDLAEKILNEKDFNVINDINNLNIDDIFINSGIYNNYYFLSAIYALLKYPNIIVSKFPIIGKSKNGQYAVKVRMQGIWKYVLLDEYFPCLENEKGEKLFAYSSVPHKEIWINLLEKAWAKINKDYSKITNGIISEIFDLFTNYSTEKVQISSKSNSDLCQYLKDALGFKYIVCVKSNNYKCYNNGIIPENYYIVNDIKQINNTEPDAIIHLINIFGALKFSGNWSKNNNKWMPSLKNHILFNERDFYISLDDLINNFSILYNLKICSNENDWYYNYIRYKKKDVLHPNVAVITVPDDTNITFQFHQKNIRFSNEKNIRPTTGFIFIVDKESNYIDSISSNDQCFNLDLNLGEGEYYIYTDTFYRYISKNDLHGYTLTFNSDKEISILEQNSEDFDYYDFMKNALLNYMILEKNQDNIELDFEMKIYKNSKEFSKFPFLFKLFDNKSPYENQVNIMINNKYGNVKNFALYLDNEELNDFAINNNNFIKTIAPNSLEAVIAIKLTDDFNFDIDYECNPKITDEELENLLRQSEKTYLDDGHNIIQFLYKYDHGCFILIENLSEEYNFKMKLALKGLINPEQVKGDTIFTLEEKESKLFKLYIDFDNPSTQVSFQFLFVENA